MRRLSIGLGEYATWVHVTMACVIGLPLMVISAFLIYRAQMTQRTLAVSQQALARVENYIQSQNADTRRILSNQEEQLRILKGMGK